MAIITERGWSVEPIELSVKAEPKTVNVGDEITFEIQVRHLPDVQVFLPGTEVTLSPFEVKRYRPLPRSEEGGFVKEGGSYRLTIFELGTYVIPSLSIPYANYEARGLPPPSLREGSIPETDRIPRQFVKTQPIPIVVRSLLQEKEEVEKNTSLPLRESDTFPVPGVIHLAKRIVAFLAGVGFLSLTVYGVFYFWPKTSGYRPPIPPHRIAEKVLREIEHHPEGGGAKELYVQLSGVLREYLAKRFETLSLHLSTGELLSKIKEERALAPFLPQFSDFFRQVDLVKFADSPASTEEWRRLLSFVHLLVKKTTPQEKREG